MWAKNQWQINKISRELANCWISDITSADVDACLLSMQSRNLKPSSRNRYLAEMKAIFNYAVKQGYLKSSPVQAQNIKFDNARIRWITEEEQKRVLDACLELGFKCVYRMVLISLNTGMRLGEKKALKLMI
jgi:integrase